MLHAPETWSTIRALHVLSMAFFVGGQLFMVVAVLPAFRGGDDRDRERLRAAARRFGYGSLVAIAILLVTGSALASHEELWSSSVLKLKLTLVASVGVLLVWHTVRPHLHVIEGLVFVLSLLIVWQGLSLAHGVG